MAEKEKRPASRTPAPWDPFAELDVFEGWSPFREMGLLGPRLRRLFEERPAAFAPAMDLSEDDGRYVVTAEIPGVAKDDVHVEVDEGVLSVSGEKRSEREEKKEKRRWVERSYGSFHRSFRLPADADADRIAARFEKGVLTIEIPKTEQRKPRVVSVGG